MSLNYAAWIVVKVIHGKAFKFWLVKYCCTDLRSNEKYDEVPLTFDMDFS